MIALIAAVLATLVGLAPHPWELLGAELTATDELSAHAKFLAAPERSGRGVGAPRIAAARDYIAAEFASYGLLPGGDDDSYLQSFEVAVGVKVKAPSRLALGPGPALTLDEEWLPLGLSASGLAKGEAVFAGYGITAKDYGYDDYAGIDVKGKIVVVLRYEPAPKDDRSPFRKSPDFSAHAALRAKANNARNHGAVGMILVDLDDRGEAKSELMSLRSSLWRSGNSLVAVQIKRQAAEDWFAAQGISLKDLKTKIDREEKPASMVLAGGKLSMQVTLEEERERAENVVGILPGRDPLGEKEYLLIGAHYDHLGLGHYGARDQSAAGLIHHGADDNASGTSVLLHVARRLSQIEPKPPRSIVFVAFSAEELGLHGSRHFVGRWPLLASTKSMINLDMVGRLRDDRVTIFGVRSAPPFQTIVTSSANQVGLQTNLPDGLGPSDHLSFYNKQIPVLHFFTGSHPDYHRPGDTWDKLNYDGMARIGDLVLGSALAIAALPETPNFVSLPSRPPTFDTGERRGTGVYLGIIPEYSRTVDGVLLAGVAPGSPAAAAGLREGDVIVQLADTRISNIEDLTDALGTHKPAAQVTIIVKRGDGTSVFKTTLGSRR
ncbi:MAG TPA: M20/M25/M40 family metallo-hydrolase [Candidatus Binatia bacterium]|nr:M20/M25/M40 family metallo-hydrolase [Candidatus Binatia bacterium]